MTKATHGKDGKFTGSIGSGKANVPRAAEPATAPTTTESDQTPPFAGYAAAHAAAHGRQLVFAQTAKEAHAAVDPHHTHVAATLKYTDLVSRAEIQDRLRTAGFKARIQPAYGRDNDQGDVWIVSREPGTDQVHAISPLMTNDKTGWKVIEQAEKSLRGSWRKRGRTPLGVEAEACSPNPS